MGGGRIERGGRLRKGEERLRKGEEREGRRKKIRNEKRNSQCQQEYIESTKQNLL